MAKNRKKILEKFLRTNELAVLSTVAPKNAPESAVVEFSSTENLELIFDTLPKFRKYKNLAKNKNVSVVIGLGPKTLQYEGAVKELKGTELDKGKKIHYKKFPDAVRFEKFGVKFFKISPKWARFTDVSKRPWGTFEIKF